jgi:hypothetical protein
MISETKTDWSISSSAKSEIDNWADTCCAGRNFRPLEFTGMTCSVSPFHEDYKAMQDIPIATCATAVDLTDGTTVILIVNEALYFGDSMDHSLINPNQIRVTSIPVNDDPFNQTRPFGIGHPETFIPFATEGATIYFTSRTPTNEELEHFQFRQIELTDEDEWKPERFDLSQGVERKISMVNRMRQLATNCESDVMLMSVSEALTLNTQSIQAIDRGAKEWCRRQDIMR